jgi:hypothetical protein
MNAPNFTPGPWEIVKVNPDRALIRNTATDDAHAPGYLAEVRNVGAAWQANAALIAAAPDLLKALEEVDEMLDGQEDIDGNGGPNNAMRLLPIVRAAIAKATGETP